MKVYLGTTPLQTVPVWTNLAENEWMISVLKKNISKFCQLNFFPAYKVPEYVMVGFRSKRLSKLFLAAVYRNQTRELSIVEPY